MLTPSPLGLDDLSGLKAGAECEHFNACASCVLASSYEAQIAQKLSRIKTDFSTVYSGEIEVFKSEKSGFRNRAEFRIYHSENGADYAMSSIDGGVAVIKNCGIVDMKIARLMKRLLVLLNGGFSDIKAKCFGVEFISSSSEVIAVLLYHRSVEGIKDRLNELFLELDCAALIARSKGEKISFGADKIAEILNISGDGAIKYEIGEGAFIQPNRLVNEKMISWALKAVSSGEADLLELYCGHGNFTMALAKKFKRVLATEISKKSINDTINNCKLNGVQNISFIRMSAEELEAAFRGEREFRRLKDIELKSYDFSTILVDPPRAGCSEAVLKLAAKIQNIIYISCNPSSLKRDLEILKSTHKAVKFAIFDQFAHTNHTECGVVLQRIG